MKTLIRFLMIIVLFVFGNCTNQQIQLPALTQKKRLVEPGTHLLFTKEGNVYKIDNSTGAVVQDYGKSNIAPKKSNSPSARFSVSAGSSLVTYAYWENTASPSPYITYFTSTYTVPTVPSYVNQWVAL